MEERTRLQDLSLENFAGGAAGPRFEKAAREVLANVLDPNTEAKATRSITMVFTFTPNEQRSRMGGSVSVKTKLAPHSPAAGDMHIGQRNGQPVVKVYDVNQADLWEQDESVRPLHEHPQEQALGGGDS